MGVFSKAFIHFLIYLEIIVANSWTILQKRRILPGCPEIHYANSMQKHPESSLRLFCHSQNQGGKLSWHNDRLHISLEFRGHRLLRSLQAFSGRESSPQTGRTCGLSRDLRNHDDSSMRNFSLSRYASLMRSWVKRMVQHHGTPRIWGLFSKLQARCGSILWIVLDQCPHSQPPITKIQCLWNVLGNIHLLCRICCWARTASMRFQSSHCWMVG
jgi:hypothetical protein